jgi:N-acetylglutamate synthase-like GNAT family acetyltransferase
MKMVPFRAPHIEGFLTAARNERWITGRSELEFLLKTYPEGCFVSEIEGRAAGFITAIRYSRSAWIGNLLVLPEQRLKGAGKALMKRVLSSLDLIGCHTVWLTASSDGAHLYRTLGFSEIDKVQRWKGRSNRFLQRDRMTCPEEVAHIDSMGWGDSRRAIFYSMPEKSTVFSKKDSFLLCSSFEDACHIGPWGAVSRKSAADLLDDAIGDGKGEVEVFLDVPENNSFAGEILLSKGFSVSGSTLLMYRGIVPEYRPEYVYSLASMGSYG